MYSDEKLLFYELFIKRLIENYSFCASSLCVGFVGWEVCVKFLSSALHPQLGLCAWEYLCVYSNILRRKDDFHR